jgi:hypothetical protein
MLMGTSMLVIGSILAINGTKYFDSSLGRNFIKLDNKASSLAVIIFIYIFVAGFAYSWGPVILSLITIIYTLYKFY